MTSIKNFIKRNPGATVFFSAILIVLLGLLIAVLGGRAVNDKGVRGAEEEVVARSDVFGAAQTKEPHKLVPFAQTPDGECTLYFGSKAMNTAPMMILHCKTGSGAISNQ